MSAMTDALIQEIEQEGSTARRVLERVPDDKMSWKPHQKSMSLEELANHVATIPGAIAGWAAQTEFDFGGAGHSQENATTTADLLKVHDSSVEKAKQYLQGLDDKTAMETWTGKMGDQVLMQFPRVVLIRSIMLNHWYHHRGQLSVYLRLLDVPVPSIYGPSADEQPA